MKKLLTTLTILTASASFALAGSGKAVYDAKAPLPDPGCDCFGTGFEFSGFGGALLPSDGDSAGGGGVGFAYFFTENVGVDVSYGVYATDPSEEHLIVANLVYRLVDRNSCIAPYFLIGGGLLTNSQTDGLWDIGGGIDFRFPDSCLGVFVDATYNWVDGDRDFTLVRGGIRIPF
jgi:hypothetical protein